MLFYHREFSPTLPTNQRLLWLDIFCTFNYMLCPKKLQRYSGDTHILNTKLELSKRRSVKNFVSFSVLALVHTLRRPHYASKFENAFCLWKRIKCFSSTLRRRSLKSNSQRSFWICHSVIEITWLAWRHCFRKFSVHNKTQSSVCKFLRFQKRFR